jgi:hypothetical protein
MPTEPARSDPEDGFGPNAADDQMPAEPGHTHPVARTRILVGGFIARHPTLLRALEWLGWHNPGGSINP